MWAASVYEQAMRGCGMVVVLAAAAAAMVVEDVAVTTEAVEVAAVGVDAAGAGSICCHGY